MFNSMSNKKNKLVYDVGINDLQEPTRVQGNKITSYVCWKDMLKRCYSEKYHSKQPTYIECTVCHEWLLFSNFKKWYNENHIIGFHLDKDILVEGNKVYSQDICRFVPPNINTLLNDRGNARGNLPLGITRNHNSYKAQCNDGSGKQLTKTFKTVEEAVAWYSETKTRVVREVAKKALDAGEIQQDIFDALTRRKF